MASSKEYLQFILEQLTDLEEINYRAMMGEYASKRYDCTIIDPHDRSVIASITDKHITAENVK